MSKQAVRLWESVLGQLAALSKISSTTLAAVSLQDDALLRIKALEGKISTCDTPQSEWKRIINEIKVPQAIAAALKHQPGKPAPRYAVRIACVDCLLVFSTAAADSKVFANTAASVSTFIKQMSDGLPLTPQRMRSLADSLGNTKQATGLALSAVKQLQQSGFLELLPQLLSDAAAALAGLSDAAILAWAAGAPQQGSDLLLGSSITGGVATLQNHAYASLSLFGTFWQDWPIEDTVRQQVLGPNLMPALQLISTLNQFVGRCADLLPEDPEQINPDTLLEMQHFVTSVNVVMAGVLCVIVQAALTAFEVAQTSRAGQGTASLGAAPGRLSEIAAALWDAPAVKAVASADLLGVCCLTLLNTLSADMLQPLLHEAHRIPAADDTIASMGVATSGVDGSSRSGTTPGLASSSRMPAGSSSGSSNAAGTRSRQQPVAEDVKQIAAAWQLACSDTLQLPSPFTHMLGLLGYSRRALILTVLQNNNRCCNTTAGSAAALKAAPRQHVGPYVSPGAIFQTFSVCLQLASTARQSPSLRSGALQRLVTILRTAAAAKVAAEQQQNGQPEPQASVVGNDIPNQMQDFEQQLMETTLDADWEAQMNHTLLAVVLVWLGQKDVTANSYAESLSDAADVLSCVIGRIGQERNLAQLESEAMMQCAAQATQSAQDTVLQQLSQGMNPGPIIGSEPALAQCSLPGQSQDCRPQPAASPWFTPAMQEVGLVQLLSTACQQLLGHLDSLPADSTAAAHPAGSSSATSGGSSSSSSSSGATSNVGGGSSSVGRCKETSNNSSGRAVSRGSSSSSGGGGGGGGAPADALKALGSVAESISLLAGMSLPDKSCKSYAQAGTPAANPFCNLLATAPPQLQNAPYVHHRTTSKAYITWRQQFVRLAGVLEAHVRVSASSNSSLKSFKQALTAGSCLLNPQHPAQVRSGNWVGTVTIDAALQAGPGSREEQQLFSLACSLLKACSIRLMGGQLDPEEQQVIKAHTLAIGTMACSLIMHATMVLKGQGADSGMPSGGTPTAAAVSNTSTGSSLVINGSNTVSSSHMVSSSTTGNKGRSAVLVVPWLVLLGRFCLCCSSHALTAGDKSAPQAEPGSAQEIAQTQLLLMPQQAACAVSVCVGDPIILSELAAASYDTVALASELAAAAAAAAEAAAEPELNSPTTTAASGPAAVQYLRSMGLALTKGLPFKLACNNPSCSNMAGLSELQLVSGRARCCSGCRVARYCSEACQRKHWKQHKPACKALAAAVAAGT